MITVVGGCGAAAGSDHEAASAAHAVLDGWDCGWTGCSYYLDRPTTQRWAAFFRRWDKATDAPVAFATAYCTRFGATAAGICAAGVIGASSLFLDHLQQADAMGGCLRFQVFDLSRPGGMFIDADNGENCTGTRT